jgi:hypothetical protein
VAGKAGLRLDGAGFVVGETGSGVEAGEFVALLAAAVVDRRFEWLRNAQWQLNGISFDILRYRFIFCNLHVVASA